MKKIYIIYTEGTKTKKAVLDENMYKKYQTNPLIKGLQVFETESLMEKVYAKDFTNKKTLLG